MKDIKDYECLYKVSKDGKVFSIRNNIYLKPNKDRKGYLYVNLSKNGKVKLFHIHRLVANAFIPNKSNKEEVNHINGIKTDNKVENLEWVSHKENMQHAYKHNLIAQESIVNNVNRMIKATSKPINQIKNGVVINSFESINEASRITKIKAPHICEVLKGKRNTTMGYKWEYAKLP